MTDLPPLVAEQRAAAERVMGRCRELASISANPDQISRFYLTPEHHRANALVAQWMQAAGMATHVDPVGSIVGLGGDPHGPRLALGSHLDTIPDAGAYDGILGVLVAIEAAAQCLDLPFALEILGFGEEEGVRFGTTLISSKARAGAWDAGWLQLEDSEGVSLYDAMQAFGLDPERANDALGTVPELGYVEVHIEQGPILEARELPLGVVTAIAGAQRFTVTFTGLAGHAGTVPMALRQDALVVAAAGVTRAQALAVELDVVATVGALQVEPGAVNVIPGAVTLTLDVRSADDAKIETFMDAWRAEVQQHARAGRVAMQLQQIHAAPAVACAAHLQDRLLASCTGIGAPAFSLPSGAGHDAMAMAQLCDVGMLFLRCDGGLSHHPDERVSLEDVAWTLAALKQFLTDTAKTL
ncbi:MAG: allantoate amidohydrolase [Pseudomonadota bacterium]